jgi:hypothetical protein
MIKKHPTAFVSYSWDSIEHQEWVFQFTNKLRNKGGVDADIDKFQTQAATINLNSMMISNIRDKDYIILVLTENYAKKADELKGGVGFETLLTMPLIMENPNKIILVTRQSEDFNKVIPFHYKGIYAIDFSNDEMFEEKFTELIYRIHNVPLYEKAELGEVPTLKPRASLITNSTPGTPKSKFNIPSFKTITDIDKQTFMKESFHDICNEFSEFLDEVKSQNSNFEYIRENVTTRECDFRIYLNGYDKTGVKIWLDNEFNRKYDTIKVAYNDTMRNSFNDFITCEVSPENTLQLSMNMNMFSNKSSYSASEIVIEFWDHIKHYIQ